MSFGKMRALITIAKKEYTQDDDGFKTKAMVPVAHVRAYREGRHGSKRWANLSSFTDATDLFRFRTISDVEITTEMCILCDDSCFEITSVEDVKGRGMYIEALAREVKQSGKSNVENA